MKKNGLIYAQQIHHHEKRREKETQRAPSVPIVRMPSSLRVFAIIIRVRLQQGLTPRCWREVQRLCEALTTLPMPKRFLRGSRSKKRPYRRNFLLNRQNLRQCKLRQKVGLRAILTDQNKLVVAVGGVTALAGGIYTTRKGAKVIWSYVDRILGQPSLVRESTIGKYPWSGFSRGISTHSRGADKGYALKNGDGFGDVILHPSLQKRIQHMYNLAQKCMQSKPASSPHKLMELLTGILGENTEVVLAACSRSFGPWMVSHAVELLTAGSTHA